MATTILDDNQTHTERAEVQVKGDGVDGFNSLVASYSVTLLRHKEHYHTLNRSLKSVVTFAVTAAVRERKEDDEGELFI